MSLDAEACRELFLAIIKVAIQDYADAFKPVNAKYEADERLQAEENIKTKRNIELWVEKMEGSFKMCAYAWDKDPKLLQSIFREKMARIRKGEPLRKNEKPL